MSCAVRSMPKPMLLFRRPGWICWAPLCSWWDGSADWQYVQGDPVPCTSRMIINAGIETVVIRDDKGNISGL